MTKSKNEFNLSEVDEKYAEESVEFLNYTSESIKPNKKLGIRHVQAINISFLVFVAYCSRSSFSVAIVAMNDRNATINPDISTFNWTNKNVVQSAFFIGYVPSQIIMSFVIAKMELKWITVISVACSSIFGIMIPSMAYWFEDKGVIAMRILQGLSQGTVFPSVQLLLARWVPPNERAGLAGTVHSARPVATLMSMMLTGYIAGSWYGWPLIFYIFNGIGLIWCLSFSLFSFDNPASHPSISQKERRYIETSLGQENDEKNMEIPWKEIGTSLPFWALVLNMIGYNWGFWTQQTQIPIYMKYVMKFDIEANGSLSALPYLIQWLLTYFFCFTSDYLLNKKIWTISIARKTMNSIGLFLPAITFIILQNSGPDESTKAVILLTLGIALNSACFCGLIVNIIDLSPKFASILEGISNGPSHVTGLLAPLFVQAIVKDETNPNEWTYVFSTAAGLYIAAGFIFIFIGSGDVQIWNSDKNKRKDTNKLDNQHTNFI